MNRNTAIFKTISLFLCFWMLFASIGISVDFHYCDGEIVDWNLTGNELICEHAQQQKEESSCCKASHEPFDETERTPQIEDGCCDTGEAEMIMSQEFDFGQTEIECFIPTLLYFSLNLSNSQVLVLKTIQKQEKEFPPVPILRKLASIQMFII